MTNQEEIETLKKALELERATLRTLLEIVPAGVFGMEADSETLQYYNDLSKKMAQRFSFLPDSAHAGMLLNENGENSTRSECPLMRALRTGENCRGEIVGLKNADTGEISQIELRAAPVRDAEGRIVRALGCYADPGEVSFTLSSNVLEFITDAFFSLDSEGCFTYMNRPAEELLQRRRTELLGKSIWEEYPNSTQSPYLENYERAFREKKTVRFEVYGAAIGRWLHLSLYPMENGLAVYLQDITHLKEVQTALQKSEEELRVTLRSIGDAVMVTDKNGSITFMNPVAQELTGWAEQDAIGKNAQEVFHIVNETTRNPVVSPIDRVLTYGVVARLANHTVLIAQNGKELPIEDSGAPIYDSGGKLAGVVLVFRDTSEHRLMEKQLLQSQKMEALGRLAGGIAHDFNNLLTAIIGYAELIETEIARPHIVMQYLHNIQTASERATALIRQLLSFARQDKPRFVPVNVPQLVEETLPLLQRLLGEDIELVTDVQGSSTVMGDINQMTQVLVNLAVNARDAMPGGGKLTISARERRLAGADLRYPRMPEGDYVELKLQDTGTGMLPEQIPLLFEPFYTTKPEGSGTGLGLSICHGIVQTMEGAIIAESASGHGAAFYILLPVHSSKESKQPAALQQENYRGTETILLVEDNTTVRAMLNQALGVYGYTVLQAASGSQALDLYLRHAGRVHMVISDLVMPNQSGRELVQELKHLTPALPALLLSAHIMSANAEQIAEDEGIYFLAKPHSLRELLKKVRTILDEAGTE